MAKLKYRELTYRTRPEDPRYFGEMAERLIGRRVVLWVPREDGYRRAWLISTNYLKDSFVIRWRRREPKLRLRGLWRIHNPGLFTDLGLPEPRGPAIVVEETITDSRRRETEVATTSKRGAKKGSTKASSNGGRSRDILEDYTEAERKRLAKAILKMKKAGESWGDIAEELDLPGERPSVAGRRLLREYADDGESVIRQRNTSTKAKSKRRAKDEDDEDEDDEDEAPPKRRTRRTVGVKSGRGSRKNP
jgi:hypothetical protein